MDFLIWCDRISYTIQLQLNEVSQTQPPSVDGEAFGTQGGWLAVKVLKTPDSLLY